MRTPYLPYRPLRSGIAIINRVVDQYGTLGFFGYSDDGAQWLVSCYHVLCRVDFSAYQKGEEIFQPDYNDGSPAIATVEDRADPVLDCAAGKLAPGIIGVNEVLGLGAFDPNPVAAVAGMRVFKYGVTTELTEGVVQTVVGDTITIGPNKTFSGSYELSKIGDSGALWIEQGTLRPVGLHRQGEAVGAQLAIATRMTAVLNSLKLRI